MSNERDTPVKMMERFEAKYGTYTQLSEKIVTLSQYDVEERQNIEHLLEMHTKLQLGVEMYNLGYQHGKEDTIAKDRPYLSADYWNDKQE